MPKRRRSGPASFGLAVEPSFDGLVSAVVPVREAESAFALAADRSRSCKVLLDFGN